MFVRGFRRFLYRLDNVRVRLIFYAILMLVYIFVVLRLRECGLLPLYSGDEHYYTSTGLKYVAGSLLLKLILNILLWLSTL